jgi:hypothetical protein
MNSNLNKFDLQEIKEKIEEIDFEITEFKRMLLAYQCKVRKILLNPEVGTR